MPFNFHNKDRIENLLEELEGLRYRQMQDINEFLWYEDDGTIGNKEPQGEGAEVGIGYRWKGYDKYNWLCTKITIPEQYKGKDVLGLFDFGVPRGTGNTSHFESLLYLNGVPYQGVDGNHQEVFLYVEENGLEFDLKFRLWSGLNGGGKPEEMAMEIKKAAFGYLDEPTDHLYFLAKNLVETYEILEENAPNKEWILNVLVKAFTYVDFSDTQSDEFYDSVKKAWDYLDETMKGQGKPDINVSLLGHTHIDVAWLWRIRHSREKAARSFSTVNRMMKRYEDYVFIQSQPQLYDYIKTDYPEVYAAIKNRVAEGKWEPSGAMWVECDCNLVSGESIVRQILLGKNFFKKEFDYESEFLWLPDVFGYSWALPQILKKSGVTTFMTTKISWNDTNKMPYDTFMWRGMDGSEVLAHFITTPDMAGSKYYTYNGDTKPYSVKGVWENYSNKDLNKDLLIAYGYGDGGGGPSREMIENVNCMNKIPDLPKVKTETATSYFRRLHKTVEENKMNGYVPIWDGELYLEFHRGTYTSQSYNKKMNRRMEFMLRDIELLSVIASQYGGKEYQAELLDKIWKEVLCYQFHDILPGSSIKEVYDDSHEFYSRAEEQLQELKKQLFASIVKPDENCLILFNTANWVRDSYITLNSPSDAGMWKTAEGKEVCAVLEQGKAILYLPEMKPLSFTVVHRIDTAQQADSIKKTDCFETETSYYKIKWNASGSLDSIYDKVNSRELLPQGQKGNEIQIFEDKPRCFDAWELEPTIDKKMETLSDCEEITTDENALGIFVHFKWNYKHSKIKQTLCLYHHSARIDFKTEVDWQERQKLMKAAFPFDLRSVDAVFDIQYGNIRRRITRNNTWEAARFEVVAHKWVDISETGYGVALLNDCKYGYDIKDQTMRITLLKGAVDPDYTADIGYHEFTYALMPHAGSWQDAGIEQTAFDLNNPIAAVTGSIGEADSILTFDADNIELDCVKKEENGDGIIVRFHEFMGSRSNVVFNTKFQVKSWCECNLMETEETPRGTNEISLFIKPYEIKTIKLLV